MNFRLGILAIALMYGHFIFAQGEGKQFSLDEAIDYAMQNNQTLQNARDDVVLASEQYKETRAAGLPKVEGTLDYMTNFNYEFEMNFGGGGELPQTLPIPLEPGEQAVFDYTNAVLGSMGGGSTIIMEDQSNANIQVSQLIFSGQYWVGLQMAKLGQKVRETSLTLTELDVKEQVINSYYLVLITEKLLDVIAENATNLEDIYNHTNNMFKVGMAEQTDVDQIKINLSELQNSKVEMERNSELNYNMFRFLLGIDSNEEIQLTNELEDLLAIVEGDFLNVSEFDLKSNPNYKIMNMQEELGYKQVGVQKWAYAPTLVGFYNYKEKLMTTAFDLTPNHAAGLTLSVPIFAGGEKQAKVNQKKIELEQTKRNKKLLEEQLLLQNKQLTFELNNAFDNYKTQKENVEVASRVFESFQNKYKQGMVSSLDLTQANSNYLQAESNYTSSIMKLLQAKLAIDKLYNNI